MVLGLVGVILISGWFLWDRAGRRKPVIATEIPSFLNPTQELILNLSDAKSGIYSKSVLGGPLSRTAGKR